MARLGRLPIGVRNLYAGLRCAATVVHFDWKPRPHENDQTVSSELFLEVFGTARVNLFVSCYEPRADNFP
jgi:hypothetical protein